MTMTQREPVSARRTSAELIEPRTAYTLSSQGAVAQLGEHRVCNAGVASSILVGSISCDKTGEKGAPWVAAELFAPADVSLPQQRHQLLRWP